MRAVLVLLILALSPGFARINGKVAIRGKACLKKTPDVATASTGIVDMSAVANGGAVEVILGKQLAWGKVTPAFFDLTQQHYLDRLIAEHSTGGFYDPSWLTTYDTGTVSITAGSKVITGSGTALQTALCGAGGTTSVGKKDLLIWYTNADGTVGRFQANMNNDTTKGTCTDETHVTVLHAPDLLQMGSSPQSGLHYKVISKSTGSSGYSMFSNSPENYYDAVAAAYSMYYRSGQSKYRDFARSLAQTWLIHPYIDRGWACHYEAGGSQNAEQCYSQPRVWALTGLYLCALDSGCGTPAETWQALHHWTDVTIRMLDTGFWHSYIQSNSKLYNQRDQMYALYFVGLCAAVDTDATYKSTCQAKLAGYISGDYTRARRAGQWPMGVDSMPLAVQPFMLGMLASTFEMAGYALAGNHDTEAALAYSYATEAVDWIIANSYIPALNAFQWFSEGAGGATCPPGATTNYCLGNDANSGIGSTAALRQTAMPMLRAIAQIALRTNAPSYKTLLQTIWSGMWDAADPNYAVDYAYPGGYFYSTAGVRDKWAGEPFGVFNANLVPIALR